ncbi:MAG: PilZ domain-containing protein [Candidatus Acidiferrales bacterium]
MKKAWPGEERRKHLRYPCAGEALLHEVGTDVLLQGQLSDVSLGGCYVDMMYPLPSATEIELTLAVDHRRVQARGRVCASREGFGMGIAFTEIGAEDRTRLQELVNWLSGLLPQGPGERARLRVTPGGEDAVESGITGASPNPDRGDALDALLGLLERKGVISVEERAQIAKKREAHLSR